MEGIRIDIINNVLKHMKTKKKTTECLQYGVMTSIIWLATLAVLTLLARAIHGEALFNLNTADPKLPVALFFLTISIAVTFILGYRRRRNYLSNQAHMATSKYILQNLKDWAIPLIIFTPYYLTYPNEEWNDYILYSLVGVIILYGVYISYFKKKKPLDNAKSSSV